MTGGNPLIDIAVELERNALEDDYFVSRRLYPNVDFYSGIIYQAMGFPVEMFPALFVLGRAPGWLAQMGGTGDRPGAAHRPPATDLSGRGRAPLRADVREMSVEGESASRLAVHEISPCPRQNSSTFSFNCG